jgi:hypothetical protein
MRASLVLVLAACGASTPRPQPPPPVHADVAELAWLAGRWDRAGGLEHWTAAGDVLIGVGFGVGGPDAFEVIFVERPKDWLIYRAMPGGLRSVSFPLADAGDRQVVFANPEHDDPKVIRYERQGDQLAVRVGEGEGAFTLRFTAGDRPRAQALEQADLAFARDVAARGVDAWVEWFEPEGWQWGKDGPVRGPEAIRAFMAPLLGAGKLDWRPVASALAPGGKLGYTVGTWTFAGERAARGAYVTIWRRQPDGSWKVLFDTGDTMEP